MDNLLIKVLEETDDKKVFSLLTSTKDNFILWDEILNRFNHFLPHKKINKKYFWGKDLSILENFGFDIDFEDSFGNTLLFHLFSDKNNKTLSFESKDILKKTKKLYHINKNNENILFYMARNLNLVDWKETEEFISGKNLVDFIEKHPHFNLHQFNKLNRNLINQLLLNPHFPEYVFNYLIEQNVSTNHIDNDGYNVINFFPLLPFKNSTSQALLTLSQYNDINKKNKYKDSCISNFLSFLTSTNSNNLETHLKWITFIFENIIEENIPIANKKDLIRTLSNDSSKYHFNAKMIIPLQNKTIGFLKYQLLNEKFPPKNLITKKIKI